MKNPHGIAREMLIDEMLNKAALVDKAVAEWGLEYDGTVTLATMAQNGTSYAVMVRFYNVRNETIANTEY